MTIAANTTDHERIPRRTDNTVVLSRQKPLHRRFFEIRDTDVPWGTSIDDATNMTLDESLHQDGYATVDNRQLVIVALGDHYPFGQNDVVRFTEEIPPGHYVTLCLIEGEEAVEMAAQAPHQTVTVKGCGMDALVLLPPNERELLP